MLTTPVKTHIHRFTLLRSDCTLTHSFHKLVITPYRGTWLGIADVGQYGAEYNADLHVGEESCELSFASRGDNDRDDGGHAVEGGVEEVGVVVTEGDVAPGFGTRVG